MSTVDNGGAAFPVLHQEDAAGNLRAWFEQGMTLRDYFAAKELTRVHPDQIQVCDVPEAYDRLAKHCYRMADSMLKARAS